MAEVAHHNLSIDTSADWNATLTWRDSGQPIDLTGWTATAQARRAPDGPVALTFAVAVGSTDGTTILTATKANMAPLTGETLVWGITVEPPIPGDALVMEGFAHFEERIGR